MEIARLGVWFDTFYTCGNEIETPEFINQGVYPNTFVQIVYF